MEPFDYVAELMDRRKRSTVGNVYSVIKRQPEHKLLPHVVTLNGDLDNLVGLSKHQRESLVQLLLGFQCQLVLVFTKLLQQLSSYMDPLVKGDIYKMAIKALTKLPMENYSAKIVALVEAATAQDLPLDPVFKSVWGFPSAYADHVAEHVVAYLAKAEEWEQVCVALKTINHMSANKLQNHAVSILRSMANFIFKQLR